MNQPEGRSLRTRVQVARSKNEALSIASAVETVTAGELLDLLDAGVSVVVKVRHLPQDEADDGDEFVRSRIQDFGDSLCGDSTYLEGGMTARLRRAFRPPELPPLPDIDDYRFSNKNEPYVAGSVYFVFETAEFVDVNTPFEADNWYTNTGGQYRRGTARALGLYTGFDVIGFRADFNLMQAFESLCVSKEA